MASVTVQVRGLSGSQSVTLDSDGDDFPTVADVRAAAGLAEGLVLRADGQTVHDEAGTEVRDEQILVTAAPEAKHGFTA